VKDDRVYVGDMLDCCRNILSLAGEGESAFRSDFRVRDALLWNILVLGEACKHVTPATRGRWPAVPWHDIAGMRDKLVHGYANIDYDLVWLTATTDIPRLRAMLDELAAAMGPALE